MRPQEEADEVQDQRVDHQKKEAQCDEQQGKSEDQNKWPHDGVDDAENERSD